MSNFEDTVLDFDDKDLLNLEIKINPDFYIHTALLMAQKTLLFSVVKTSISEGLLAYYVFIEHLEVLCRAARYLTTDYDTKIEEFKKGEDYTVSDKGDVKRAKLANEKLRLMMSEVFGKKTATASLKM